MAVSFESQTGGSIQNGTGKVLLRREWFGGLEVELPGGRMTFYDDDGFKKRKAELTGHVPGPPMVDVVDATEMGYSLRTDALSTPGAVFLEITNRCNARCRHCYADAGSVPEASEMPLDTLVNLLETCADLGMYYLRLTGGEPTMRSDLPALLAFIQQIGIRAAINTHGRYKEKTLLSILDHGVKDIRLSLDGDKRTNDAIRGKGCYDEVMATLQRLAEYNSTATEPADPTINFVMMKSNRHCMEHVIEAGAELGFKVSIGLMRPAGRASLKEMLAPVEVASAARKAAEIRSSLGLAHGQVRINFDIFGKSQDDDFRPFPFDNSKCPLGTMGFGVNSNGRISACNYLGHLNEGEYLGQNIGGADIMQLWTYSSVLNQARSVRRGICAGCRYYRNKCNGGCPMTASFINNNMDGRDPYCVREISDSMELKQIGIG